VTYLAGNQLVIEPTEPATCELCGKVAELRPYGPDGKSICYECGMADEEATMKRFRQMMLGEAQS